MAVLTPEQFKGRLTKFAQELPKVYREAGLEAITTLESNIAGRIFNDGKDADGNKIGNYSTKATLVGSSSFKSKTAANKVLGSKAKRAKLDWVTVGGNSLAVLEGGYKEIRRISNLSTDTVNLKFQGDLARSFKKRSKKNIFELYIKGDDNLAKARGNEDRFDTDIFEPSKEDRETVEEIYTEKVAELIDKLF